MGYEIDVEGTLVDARSGPALALLHAVGLTIDGGVLRGAAPATVLLRQLDASAAQGARFAELRWRGEDGSTGTIVVGADGRFELVFDLGESELSEAAVQALAADLGSEDPAAVRRALDATTHFAPKRAAVFEALRRLGAHDDVELRRLAPALLVVTHPGAPDAAEQSLLDFAGDPHPWVRAAAAEAFGELGVLLGRPVGVRRLTEMAARDEHGPAALARAAMARFRT